MVWLYPYKIMMSKYIETVSCIVVNDFIQVDFGEARLLSGLLMQGIRPDQAWVQAFQVFANALYFKIVKYFTISYFFSYFAPVSI
jgi:hypothetical protein